MGRGAADGRGDPLALKAALREVACVMLSVCSPKISSPASSERSKKAAAVSVD